MKKLLSILLVVTMILLSGSVFFTLKYVKVTRYIFMFETMIFIFYLIIKKIKIKYDKKNAIKLFVLYIIILPNFLFNSGNGIVINSLNMFIVVFFCLYVIQSNISKIRFKKTYINSLFFLCIISLFIFYTGPILHIFNFPFSKTEMINFSALNYSFYHNWGPVNNDIESIKRNSGIFWEPGAYQCYINLAILILLFDEKQVIVKKRIIYIAIFIITLISTKSTTGYICLLLILIYSSVMQKIKFKKFKKFFIVIATFLTIILSIGLTSNKVITEKFQSSNTSYSIRTNDYRMSMYLIKLHPLKGLGYTSDELLNQELRYNILLNSNGLLLFIMQFGIPAFIIYTVLLFIGIRDFFKTNVIDSTFILLIFCIMFASEYILFFPIWLTFLFSWYENDLTADQISASS